MVTLGLVAIAPTLPNAGRRGGTSVDARIERLNNVSQQRLVDPDEAVPGGLTQDQVLPDALLSVCGLGLDLTAAQRARLSREEVAAMVETGIRFEAVLEMGFAAELLRAADLGDPRIAYLLHEVGEETRHQRLFLRLRTDTGATARNPFRGTLVDTVMRRVVRWVIRRPATFYTLVLAGEEIPDLLQRLAAEHPDTDPFVRAVNRYHRAEEARHLSFARMRLAELWPTATLADRFGVRHVAPRLISIMFASLVHPGVYAAVGLPARSTWTAAIRSAPRRALRAAACQPVLDAVIGAGAFTGERLPSRWARLVAGADPAYLAALTGTPE